MGCIRALDDGVKGGILIYGYYVNYVMRIYSQVLRWNNVIEKRPVTFPAPFS